MVLNRKLASQVSLVLGVALVGGCGGKLPPTEKIAMVETSISSAKEQNAPTLAPLEIKLAEEKLQKAKELITDKDYEEAALMLDRALQDAKLAEIKSQSETAKKSAQEMRDSIETLRQEIKRK